MLSLNIHSLQRYILTYYRLRKTDLLVSKINTSCDRVSTGWYHLVFGSFWTLDTLSKHRLTSPPPPPHPPPHPCLAGREVTSSSPLLAVCTGKRSSGFC